MFLLNLPINVKEQAAIERRQREEQERLSRIFNVKYRTIGIDKTSLDEQVKERQYLKNLEKQRNDAFNREMIHNDLKLLHLNQEELCQQRQNAKELDKYRYLYQKPENTREWDLNNPNRLKYLTPTRINDDDSRLGPSSGQIFAGEDLQAYERKKVQQKQLKNYFDIQIMNKIKRNDQEYLANRLYDYKQMELYEQSNNLKQIEYECHRAMNIATQNYNKIIANEAMIRETEQKTREREEQLAEIVNTTFSDILTENSKNIFDSRNHIIVDRWKGMNKEQLNDIRHQQLAQINERQKINNNEKYIDKVWGQYKNAIAKQAITIDQQIEEDKRQYCSYLANENKKLAKIQHEYQDYLNSSIYRSAPTAAFYQQFNTTSR